jgi:uncharacterized protein YcbK (DUF882 family)
MSKINYIKIARFFSLYEFECPCCKRVMLSPDLLTRLNHLRNIINRPIYINSGYRCKEENHRVGGVSSSYHLLGMAADIHVKDFLLSDLLIYAQEIGFNGIGFYENNNFLHLDIRPGPTHFWKG